MKFRSFCARGSLLQNLFTVFVAGLILPPTAFCADVTLAWDPSPDSGIASYRIHYGAASGSYTSVTNAGLALQLTVSGLTEGTTYYFAATAVGTNQMESDFSNEISYTVPLPVNSAPTITSIANQTIPEDGVAGPITFTVADAETTAGSLTLTASSGNASLIPLGNIVFGGSGASRTVTLTPAANLSGSAQITITVSDGELTASTQFTVTVNSVNDLPTIAAISNQVIDEDGSAGPLGFVVGDLETAPGSLVVGRASSNPALLPEANIVLGGSGANRTVTLTPVANASGSAQVTLTVSDGTDVVSRTFTLTVNPVNDAPTIALISDQVIDEDHSTGPIAVTANDVDSAANTLTLSATSSNPTLVPSGNVVFGGSGSNRTVTVTPAANQFGTAQITVTVSDGSLTASRTFVLTVNSVEDPPSPPNRLRLVLGT